jgi:hypothetical protein
VQLKSFIAKRDISILVIIEKNDVKIWNLKTKQLDRSLWNCAVKLSLQSAKVWHAHLKLLILVDISFCDETLQFYFQCWTRASNNVSLFFICVNNLLWWVKMAANLAFSHSIRRVSQPTIYAAGFNLQMCKVSLKNIQK